MYLLRMTTVSAAILAVQKINRSLDLKRFNELVMALEQESTGAKANEFRAIKAKQDTETSRQTLQQQAAVSKASLREQLNALSITNDHLVEWLMRTTNKDLPELLATDPTSEIIADELRGLLKLIEGDIRNLTDCHQSVKNVDYVLHQAALGSVPRSIKDPITSNDVNVSGFLNMLSASRDSGFAPFLLYIKSISSWNFINE